ncbi:hypothetical protein niasHT_010080 [Heterodera trifolii]|uniref:Exportin-2 n=1 Tax=Heterodera trifolii TaxID=157864 RepID=A0ABD2LX66_9BILA
MSEQNSAEQLIRLLEATLLPDSVKGAQDELLKLTAYPGFARTMLRIICDSNLPAHIRNAASISLKNFVRINWFGEGEAPLADDEREQIRSALLETIFQLPSYVRPQMIEIVCQISKVDFPDRWPQVIQLIAHHLQAATDFDQLSVSLATLEQLINRYRHEMRSNKLWTEIILVVNTVAEPLTQLYARMLQFLPDPANQNTQLGPSDRLSWLQIVLELTRIYHSLISQDLPEYFEDNLTPWMEGFLQLLELKLPELEAKSVDLEPNEHDKLRCEICEIATLFSQRFEECFIPYTERFIASVWNLLVMTDSRIRFDSLVSAALSFLAAICQRPHYASHFRSEGVLKAICENVVVKNLMLRSEDVEIYENEPFEFLKRDIEGSDLETRRRGAADFVRALCKQFESEVCALLSSAIQSFLSEYHKNPALNFAKKDVVYYLVSALASKSTTARHGTTDASQLINVADFYQEHVRSDLLLGPVNDLPILRGDALKFLVLFRKQLKPEQLIECLRGQNGLLECSIIRFLSSAHVLIHHYVAYAVERLFLMKNPTNPQETLFNASNVPIDLLIDALFDCFRVPQAYETHYVMKALMRTFSLIDDRMAANSHLYVNKLFQMITEAVRVPKNPLFVHYIFESLCILIRRASSKVSGGLDQHVIPIIELILGNDLSDFVPYVLQIIALMLDQSQAEKQRGIEMSQEAYVRFFPTLLRPDYWLRSANVPALVLVFESFIRCVPQLVFSAQYSDQILGIFQRLIGSKAYDQHGFRLANTFISHLDLNVRLRTPTEQQCCFANDAQQNAAKQNFQILTTIHNFCVSLCGEQRRRDFSQCEKREGREKEFNEMSEQNSAEQLIRLLEATLLPDSVKGAQDELLKLTAYPGFARTMLRIICDSNLPAHIRNAASISLKNFVRINWFGEGEAPLADDEREQIRSALLETIFQLPSYVRPQMIEIVCQISKVDFPDRWPQVIQLIAHHLQAATDFDQLSVSLATLEQLINRYRHEMRSNKLWTEIILVVNTVAEPLTQLYARMLQFLPDPANQNTQLGPSDRLSWLQIVLELTRIYHSLISQDLPEYFEDNLTPWMEGFLQLLELKLPELEAKSVDLEPNEHDKLRCEICEIATLFSQRFEECFIPYTERFIASVWNLLVMTDSRIRFDSLVSAALSFLAAICQRPHYASHFRSEGVLKAICENVVVKNLMLRSEDVEIYENEPFEFLKRDIEGSDLETRRRGAADFVRALCKQFESEVCALLSSAIQSFLSEYHKNPALNFAKKDVVYYLVSALASKSTTARHGTTDASQLINVADFYQEHVRSDLLLGPVNDLPILRGDALKFLVLFRKQLKPEQLIECLRGQNGLLECSIIRFLSSAHVLIHHYVAYAVERLFLMKNPTNPQAYETHYVMKALMRTFSLIDDRMAANSHLYVNKLFQMITEAASSKVSGGLDQHVIPIIELILGNDLSDFVPYVLQIIALMLDQSQAEKQRGIEMSQEAYVRFFPTLLRPDYWLRSANVPALVLVFESFIRCVPQLVFSAQYSDQILGIFQRLIGSKAYDQHGFRLANTFISHLDLNAYERPLNSNVVLLTMLNRMQQNKTSKFSRQFTIFVFRYAASKGGATLANSLEAIQSGIYGMVLDKILLNEMQAMPQTTTYEEKRIVTIGAAKLITETTAFLGPRYAQIIELAVNILEAFEHKTSAVVDTAVQEREETAEVSELEYSDPYCKLSYAQHPEPFAPEIGNIKMHFAQAVLFTVRETNPENFDCLNARVQNCLRAYSSTI